MNLNSSFQPTNINIAIDREPIHQRLVMPKQMNAASQSETAPSPYPESCKEASDRPTLEQMLHDFGRSSMGINSRGRSSLQKQHRVIDLDLNSIEFNTPPKERLSSPAEL